MQYQSIVLVDGENLVLRYQSMVKSGRIPRASNLHIQDCFTWNPDLISKQGPRDVVRVAYYTTVVGDDEKIQLAKNAICNAEFTNTSMAGLAWLGTLVPHVFKKQKNGAKTKSVDINLTIDALRYAYGSSIEQLIIITGDGDYIPLLREVMARGKMIQVWALSDGLNPDIKHNVDDLYILDEIFFLQQGESEA